MRLAPATLLLLCTALSGCLSLQWERDNLNEPIGDEVLANLQPGEADLTQCLAALGAPNLVWEYHGSGIAMAYAWVDAGGWGFRASYSFIRFGPAASFSYSSADDLRNGVVLMFDDQLMLESLQRGYLKDLVPSRQRPAPLPEDLEKTADR